MKKFMRTVLLAFTICHPLSYAIVMGQETVNRKSEQKGASKSAHWSFSLNFGQVFDSNIDQDQKGLRSFGFSPSFSIFYRDNQKRPSFQFNYEVGRHRYSRTDRWDRQSHLFVASYERARPLSVQ